MKKMIFWVKKIVAKKKETEMKNVFFLFYTIGPSALAVISRVTGSRSTPVCES